MQTDDAWAIVLGICILMISLLSVVLASGLLGGSEGEKLNAPFKAYLGKPGGWEANPLQSLLPDGQTDTLMGIGVVGLVLLGLMSLAVRKIDDGVKAASGAFLPAFVGVFGLGVVAMVAAEQAVVDEYGLSDALWAILLGMLISNTLGTPAWLKRAARTELYIKTGLVLLGAEVLFGKLLALGAPGIFIAWIVTPVVLITTFWFGQKILKLESPSLNMVISADMSVCGVSAAIATAAACRAKKEELSVAVGLSMGFTAVMMVVLPAFIRLIGMDPVLGGAWIGGTIDATGAVAAAGAALGDEAATVAVTVKMIQNILIGVIAFAVAVYWVRFQDSAQDGQQVGVAEIWRRFPKFVLGFLAASVIFSLLNSMLPRGEELVSTVIGGSTKTLRGWLFCLAFVSIGLESDFRTLASHFRGGKPLILYVVGQAFNLCLTLFVAWLMLTKVFPNAAQILAE